MGHDPDAVPPVGCAKGGSGNTVPLRVIPDLSEPPENRVQSSSAKGWDVFDEAPARPRLGDDAVELEPEAGPVAIEAGAAPGDGDVLAGEPAGNDINAPKARVIASEVSHVTVYRNVGPMLPENCHGEIGLLAERDGLETGAAVGVGGAM